MPTIKQKILSVFKDKIGQVFNTEEIKDLVVEAFPDTNRTSVIPSDYCYNMVNKDTSSFKLRIFHCIEDNVFICLVENAIYSGPITWKGEIVGRWDAGKYSLSHDPRV